jgi:hypothetical protein
VNTLKNIFKLYVLKSGPQFLPYSLGLLAALWCLDLVLGGAMLAPDKIPLACLIRFMHLMLWAAFLSWILRARKRSERFVQTYTAILAVETMMLVLVLLTVLFNLSPYIGIVLVLWSLAVDSNILRQALDINPWLAVGLTFMFELGRDLILFPIINAWLA